MKKFKLYDSIEDDTIREVHPSDENKIIITALDTIIERIIKIHTFQSLFEDLEYFDYCPKNLKKEYDYNYGDFKDFLETKFCAVRRINMMGMIPPFFHWIISFERIAIRLNKEQMQNFLSENYNYYKDRITRQYNNVFELVVPLYYDLSKDKFIKSI